jgi:hypothetical protein
MPVCARSPPSATFSSYSLADARRSIRSKRGAIVRTKTITASVPKRYVIAYPTAMSFWSVAVCSAGYPRRPIASPAVPIVADSVQEPERTPAAVPTSRPKSRAARNVARSPVTQTTTARRMCRVEARFRLAKNWGPLL